MPSVNDFLIDFSKEEAGGGGNNIKVPDQWHRVKVLNAKPTVSANKGTEGLEVTFAFLNGKLRKGKKKIVETLWATPKAYSRFRLLLEACDVTVPGKVKLSSIAAKIKGKELYVETETEEREGYSARSRLTFQGFVSVDDYDPDVEDEEEDDEDLEDDDEELEDEDDEEEEEEEPAPKRRAKKAPAKKRRKPEPEEEDDKDDEDEDDEDEEEEPAPRKRRTKATAKKAPANKTRKRKPADDDEDDDDLSDLDLDDL